jgi:hypothetical protein
MTSRRVFTPAELIELALAGTPAPDHDLVRWTDGTTGREHTAMVIAYWRIVEHDMDEARQMRDAMQWPAGGANG